MPADATRRVVAGSVGEITPGNRKLIVPFRGRAGIGVFNVNGTYYALRNLCPHKQGPLCVGRVGGRVVAAAPPSTYAPHLELTRDGEIIRCPWHLYEFEIATGRCLVDPQLRVKTFPVVVEGDAIVVYADLADLPEQRPGTGAPPLPLPTAVERGTRSAPTADAPLSGGAGEGLGVGRPSRPPGAHGGPGTARV